MDWQAGSDSAGEKAVLLLHKPTTEIVNFFSGFFFSLFQTIFFLNVTYNLSFWLTDSENRTWANGGIIWPLPKGQVDESLLFQTQFFAEIWQPRPGVGRWGWDCSLCLHGSATPCE